MHIASFKVENYKSFRATDEVQLAPGFAVIVGQNNVGKTALVEALSLNFAHHPHRSLRTVPSAETPATGDSVVTARFQLSGEDLLPLLSRIGNFLVPAAQLDAAQQNGTVAARAFAQRISGTNPLVTPWHNGGLASARLEAIPASLGNFLAAMLRATPSGRIEAVQDPAVTVQENARFELSLG